MSLKKNWTTAALNPVYQQLGLLTLFISLFGAGALILDNDMNWDLRFYHLYNGFSFLHHRLNHDIMGGSMQTCLNPFFDVLTYLLVMLQKPKVTAFLLGAVNGVSAFIVYHIAKMIFREEHELQHAIFPLLAVYIGLTGAGSISLLGTTTNDTYAAVLVLASVYCYLRSLDEKPARFYFSLSGLLIGAVFGLKMTNLCYLLALTITVLCCEKRLSAVLLFGCCCLLGFFIVDAAWMYQVYAQFGNPIFPYYNNVFHSPYAPPYTFNLTPALSTIDTKTLLLLPYYMAKEPNLFTTEVFTRDARLLVVALLFMLAAWRRSHYPANPALRAIAIFFISGYVIWCAEFHVYRYMLPLEMLTGVLLIALLKPLFQTAAAFLLSLMLLLVFAVVSTYPTEWGRMRLTDSYFAMAAPAVPNDAVIVLLTRPIGYVVPFFNPSAHFVNLPFTGLAASAAEPSEKLLYEHTMRVLQTAGKKENLYALGFVDEDEVTHLSYAILLKNKIGPAMADCQDFTTNIGDKLRLCKLRLFEGPPA